MSNNPFPFKGLSSEEVSARKKDDVHKDSEQSEFFIILKETVLEPIFILLIASAGVYLLLGEFSEAIFLMSAVILVSAISFFQTYRSRKALSLLEVLTATKTNITLRSPILRVTGRVKEGARPKSSIVR